MPNIFFLSATQLLELIKSQQISCEEVMRIHLERIQIINPVLNALVQRIDPKECLELARLKDRQIAQNLPLGKMHGLPIVIKDALLVKGLFCASGCKGLYKEKSLQDATIVSRLKEEGAIVLGLANVPELCRGGESNNPLYGQTKNPYDLLRTPGGSSGGVSAIVAAGGVSFGIGSDGGGSIRQPCHNTGIVGLKPTRGLVPITGSIGGDALGIFQPFVYYGPMARSVEDLFLGLSIISGLDGHDPNVAPVAISNPSDVVLKNLRIAYFTDDGVSTPTLEIQNIVKNAALSMKEDVLLVEENRPRCLGKTLKLLWEGIFLGGDRGKGFKKFLKLLGIENPEFELKEFVHQAEQVEFSVTDMRYRLVEMDSYRLEMLAFMEKYDLLITPAMPTPALPHGIGLKAISDFSYLMPFNITGWPAVVVRCGTSSEGLPIGVQVVAKPWCDHVALAVAKKLEEHFGGWKPSSVI